jgi:hypothetical protein
MVNNFYDWRDQTTKNRIATGTKPVRTHCYMDPLSTSKIQKLKYTFGIWAPPADKVVRQCRAALDIGTPFACLIPNDLVHYIAKDQRKHVVVDLQRKVDRATKITLLSPGLTWLISGINFAPTNRFKTVYAGPRVTPEYELEELVRILKDSNMTPPVAQFSTRDKWIEAQVNHQTHLLYDTLEGIHHTPDGLLVYEERPGAPLRTIVPDALQIPLVEWQHKNLCHVGSQKILTVLKQRFYWKNMRRTCRHVTDMCALCNLLKARMKHAHRHYKPKMHCTPRTAYGADYYGVRQNKEGYNNILGIIDLSDGHLVLQAVKARTGGNTAHVIFYEIIVRKGVPLLFHSDAAKEFVGKAMKALCATLGITQTNTLAHNPKGNAKIERVWAFVGRCLQAMTPAQYAQFHKYVPIIAHVWNTVPDSDTNITPFEAEHGMRCRSVAESILQDPPAEGLPASARDLRAIAVSVSAFTEALTNVKAIEKAQTANRLNANGSSKITYEIGDQVGFYLPPDADTAAQMKKKKKHILQYTGPGEIVESLSPNGTSFKIRYKGRHYYRNVMHMNRYKALDEVPAGLQVVQDTTVSVGSYVAVLDAESDTHYHLAQVTDITDQLTTLHYLGTKSKNLRSAKWTKLFHHPGSGQVVFHEPNTLVRRWRRFEGSIDTRLPQDSLIIMANVGFTSNMRINAASRNILSRLSQRHHVMKRTWMT